MQCSHLNANGDPCGAVVVRNKSYCYFHQRTHDVKNVAGRSEYEFPALEDPLSIQLGIMEIVRGIAQRRLNPETGKLLLYAMQLASANVGRCVDQSKNGRKSVESVFGTGEEKASETA